MGLLCMSWVFAPVEHKLLQRHFLDNPISTFDFYRGGTRAMSPNFLDVFWFGLGICEPHSSSLQRTFCVTQLIFLRFSTMYSYTLSLFSGVCFSERHSLNCDLFAV